MLEAVGGDSAWRSVLDVWRLPEPFVILEIDFGVAGPSCFARFTGHHRAAPSLVSVAAAARVDGSLAVCVGAALPVPRLVDPDQLPAASELVADHLATATFRHRIMCSLVSETVAAVDHG